MRVQCAHGVYGEVDSVTNTLQFFISLHFFCLLFLLLYDDSAAKVLLLVNALFYFLLDAHWGRFFRLHWMVFGGRCWCIWDRWPCFAVVILEKGEQIRCTGKAFHKFQRTAAHCVGTNMSFCICSLLIGYFIVVEHIEAIQQSDYIHSGKKLMCVFECGRETINASVFTRHVQWTEGLFKKYLNRNKIISTYM